MERFRVYDKAIQRYGYQAQMRQAQEECAELIVAINHCLRGKCSADELISEVADVFIMCEQLSAIFGVEKVTDEVALKIARLKRRLAEDK